MRHKETWKLETDPRQDIQVSKLSHDRDMKNYVSRQSGDETCVSRLYRCYSVPRCSQIITFCASRRWREMYCGHARLCLAVRGRMPTLLHGPGCNLGEW